MWRGSCTKTWYSTAGVGFMALGTDRKLYVYSEGVVSDITPVRLSATLSGPFTMGLHL